MQTATFLLFSFCARLRIRAFVEATFIQELFFLFCMYQLLCKQLKEIGEGLLCKNDSTSAAQAVKVNN